ncbi:MAG: LysM peptidoglycan-binding domain-containing protein [Planctomycetota bacterium]
MARETKVGLLIALGVVLLIGVIISDHLAVTAPQQAQADTAAAVAQFAPAAQHGIQPNAATPTSNQESKPTDGLRGVPGQSPATPRLITPDRFAEPDLGPPSRQRPETQSAEATNLLADLPSPPPAWRKVQPETTEPSAGPTNSVRGLPGIAGSDTPPTAGTSADAPPIAPTPVRQAGSEFLHDVSRGDTLASVAIKYYHDSAYADSLLAANPDALNETGQLTPGTRLIIPNRAGHIDPPTPQVAKQPETLDRQPNTTPTPSSADEPPTALMSTGRFVPITGVNAAGDAPGTLAPITAHAARSAESTDTITVEAGDSLSVLAQRHLGSQSKYLELYEANRDILDSPDKVVVGMKLKLPAGPKLPADVTPNINPAITPPARPAAQTYTVQTGDNLSRIAEKTLGSRDRWQDLYDANRDRLTTPDRVKVGQELRIPG